MNMNTNNRLSLMVTIERILQSCNRFTSDLKSVLYSLFNWLLLDKRHFDANWYLEENPDVSNFDGGSAVDHFFEYGLYEGRTARFFDQRWYLLAHDDVRRGFVDPISHFKTYGLAEGRSARFIYVNSRIERFKNRNYQEWLRLYDPSPISHESLFKDAIVSLGLDENINLFLVIDANDAPDSIRSTIESIKKQIYSRFTCVIGLKGEIGDKSNALITQIVLNDQRFSILSLDANLNLGQAFNQLVTKLTETWFAALDCSSHLNPSALFWISHAIKTNPSAALIYSDEDYCDRIGKRHSPYFKCQFNYELFLSHNLLGNVVFYRGALVNQLKGFDPKVAHDVHYDLNFRFIEKFDRAAIVHVPRVLVSYKQDIKTADAIAVVNRHLKRTKQKATVIPVAEAPLYTRVKWTLPKKPPLVSIIIPTRDRVELLKQCVDSVLNRTDYTNFEIIIIDNGSVEAATLSYFADIASAKVRIIRDDSPFNFSSLINKGAKAAKGTYLCLMNNDIEITNTDWLDEMMGFAVKKHVGCVGTRLWYPNGQLQHGGVLIGFHGVAGHLHKMIERGDNGYADRAVLHQSLSAVTAAVLLIKRSIFETVGGFDETLAVNFNDVDFCLKVRDAGYSNVYTPYAEMIHHESASRGNDNTAEKRMREQMEIYIIKARYGTTLLDDPAYSPNLSLTSEDLSFAFPPRTPSLDKIMSNVDKADPTP